MLQLILTKEFDHLPQPIIMVEHNQETLNHKLVYLNDSFKEIIGWTLDEIPDKEHWWIKAYPDTNYQKVVESLWEMEMESVNLDSDRSVTITVNIMTKHNGVIRFEVETEIISSLRDGYYAVSFKETT